MLNKLLAEWSNEKSEELREAIVALDGASKRAPFEGTTAEWVKRSLTDSVEDRGALFLALKGPKVIDTQLRLERARTFPADPRLNAAVEALLGEVPYSADSSKPVWRAAFEIVAQSRDARFAALAKELPQKWKVRALMKTWLEGAFARAVAELPKQAPAASAATLKLLEQVGPIAPPAPKPAPSGMTEGALLTAIYERPFDDAPRRAYADLLLEKGDDRGEFIVLQLEGRDPKRQAALLKKHAKKWLGAIEPVLGKTFEFRRGFLAVAMARFRHQADAEKYGALPEWGTVEHLTWSHPNPIPQGQEPWCCFAGPTMRALKNAHGAWVPHLLAAKEPWAIEELATHAGPPEHLKAVITSPLLPSLRRVEPYAFDPAWFSGFEWPERIECLRVVRYSMGADLLAKASASKLKRLEVGEERVFTRGSDGGLSKLTLRPAAESASWLVEVASAVPDGVLESVDIDRTNAPPADTSKLEAAYGARLRRPGQAAALPAAGTVATGVQPLGPLPQVTALLPLADGTLLAVGANRFAWVDPVKDLLLKEEPLSGCTASGLSLDGRLVTVGHKKVEVRDPGTGAVLQSGSVGIIAIGWGSLSFGPGRASLGPRVFDFATNEEVKPPRGSGSAVTVFAPDLSRWVRHGVPHTLHRAGEREGLPLEGAATLAHARFSATELIGCTNERVCAWELATGRLLRSRPLEGKIKWLVRSHDEKRLVVQVQTGSFDVLDAATFETVAKLPWPGPAWPSAGAFSRDGKTFYAVGQNQLQKLPITT